MIVEPRLEYVFTIRVEFDQRLKFDPLPSGVQRGYTRTSGGTVTGPRLTGRVLPYSGGDWPHFRPDGVVQFEAVYLLETSDGAGIVVKNRGCRHASPEVLAKMNSFQRVEPTEYYFRVAPIFEAPKGPHDWLNRTVIVGAADRNQNYSDFTYYAVM